MSFTYLIIDLDDAGEHLACCCTLSQFFEANDDLDPDDAATLEALQPGNWMLFGGGAAPIVKILCELDVTPEWEPGDIEHVLGFFTAPYDVTRRYNHPGLNWILGQLALTDYAAER